MKLIEAARDFADHQGGAGRPRPIWLRRAASSAYYALFHHIAARAAHHLLPSGTPTDYLRIARSFDHRAIRDVCEWIAGRGRAPTHAQRLVMILRNTLIDDVANAFIDLQEQRHAADYDHFTPFPKASVLAAVQDAETAMQKLDNASPLEREVFLSLLSLRTRLH